MQKRNFKVQRRIYRFIMWTSAIGAVIIIYREHLWWMCLALFLYTWAIASFRSISGSYINELKQMKREAEQPPFWCGEQQDEGSRCDQQCTNCTIKYRRENEKAV